MEECWKTIEGYEGMYEVSNLGQVRSLDRIILRKTKTGVVPSPWKGRILSPRPNNYGYLTVSLCKDSKVWYAGIHRLVAMAFLPNPDGLLVVNHKDFNTQNNTVDNLEWCTYSYNTKHAILGGHGPKYSDQVLERIKKHSSDKNSKAVRDVTTGEIYKSAVEADRVLNLPKGTTSYLLYNISKKDGVQFEFVNPSHYVHPPIYVGEHGDYQKTPVKCINTGKCYSCIQETSKDLNVGGEYITRSINHNKPVKGLMFCKVVK